MATRHYVYELCDEAFWRYFKAFIDDADRRMDKADEEYIRKWIDIDTSLKISILDRQLVVAAIKGESKRPKKQRRNDERTHGYVEVTDK